ncbi:MAG: ACT domain-containing protein [Anaerolineae bacterium]|jgi:aspartate kinase|nr:ACT domain-containing protein [Anaerolineae bacterium]
MEKIRIGGIMQNAHLSLLNVSAVPDRPGIASAILGGLGEQRVNVQFIVQAIDESQRDQIALCVDRDDLPTALDILVRVAPELDAGKVVSHPEAAIVSIFGPDFRERPGIAGTMFEALADEGINILAISTSISTVSCVIDSEHLEAALNALRATFDLP